MRRICILLVLITGLVAGEADPLTVWAQGLDAAIAKGEGTVALTAALDLDRFFARALDGLDIPAAEAKAIVAGARSTFAFPAQIAKSVAAGGTYRFRRILDRPDGRRPMFRLVNGDGACNWHELVMETAADGKPRIVDFHIYATGELLSATMRQTIAVMRPGASGILARLLGGGITEADADRLLATTRAIQQQRWQAVLDQSDQLPAKIRGAKMVCMLRVQAAQHLDQAVYLREMEDYATRFPDDPSQLLMSIDALFITKRFAEAAVVITKIERQVGQDAQIAVLRANLALESGDLRTARAEGTQATTLEPDWAWAWQTRMGIDLQAKDHVDLVRCLDGLAAIGMTFKDLSTLPAFADFVASPAYAAWKNRKSPTP